MSEIINLLVFILTSSSFFCLIKFKFNIKFQVDIVLYLSDVALVRYNLIYEFSCYTMRDFFDEGALIESSSSSSSESPS